MARRPAVFRPSGRPGHAEPEQRLSSRARGYSAAWDKASAWYRRLHPACEYCEVGAFDEIRDEPTTRTDHLYPQRRFAGVFWEQCWWVGSCDACDAAKQALEHGTKAALDALALKLGRPVLPG